MHDGPGPSIYTYSRLINSFSFHVSCLLKIEQRYVKALCIWRLHADLGGAPLSSTYWELSLSTSRVGSGHRTRQHDVTWQSTCMRLLHACWPWFVNALKPIQAFIRLCYIHRVTMLYSHDSPESGFRWPSWKITMTVPLMHALLSFVISPCIEVELLLFSWSSQCSSSSCYGRAAKLTSPSDHYKTLIFFHVFIFFYSPRFLI
jgi:hypothetical protein